TRHSGATSASRPRAGILDLEAPALERVVEVDRAALELLMASQIHDHLHAFRVEHEVVRRGRLVRDLHSVLEARTPASRDEHADPLERASVLLHDGLDLSSCLVAQLHHDWTDLRMCLPPLESGCGRERLWKPLFGCPEASNGPVRSLPIVSAGWPFCQSGRAPARHGGRYRLGGRWFDPAPMCTIRRRF